VTQVLASIAERRREDLARETSRRPPTPSVAPAPLRQDENPFLAALAQRRGAAIIAEIKRGSPRLGSLIDRFDPVLQAGVYRDHGAAALSVVVEPNFFHGSYEVLARCRQESGLPTIAKDFVIDELQIAWAAEAGASAVLLLAALLSAEELRRYAAIARSLGLAPLVETHAAEDRSKLVGSGWELVGINNRDLRTFAVDLEHSIRSLPELPAGALRVSESGIRDRADVERLASAGFDAFLIGESLLLADDPAATLRRLAGLA
jgi:indole-3-glycerol phosphate synthase